MPTVALPSLVSREAQRVNDEDSALASRAGTWRVEAVIRGSADCVSVIETGLRAVRHMAGPYLVEIMGAAPGSGKADFSRRVYLRHFADEHRWQYVSLDGRFPIGVLPAGAMARRSAAYFACAMWSRVSKGLAT